MSQEEKQQSVALCTRKKKGTQWWIRCTGKGEICFKCSWVECYASCDVFACTAGVCWGVFVSLTMPFTSMELHLAIHQLYSFTPFNLCIPFKLLRRRRTEDMTQFYFLQRKEIEQHTEKNEVREEEEEQGALA